MASTLLAVSVLQLGVAASAVITAEQNVGFNSAGDLDVLGDTSGMVYAGQSEQTVTGSATAGAVKCYVKVPAGTYMRYTASGADKSWNGKLVFASSSTAAALIATTTSDVCVGRVYLAESSTSLIVNTSERFSLPASA